MSQDEEVPRENDLEQYLASTTWNPAHVIDQFLGEITRGSVAEVCQEAEAAGVRLLNEVDSLIHSGSTKIDLILDGLTQTLPKMDQDLRLLRYRSDQLVSSTEKLGIEGDGLSELSSLLEVHNQRTQLASELAILVDANAWNGLESDVLSALSQGNFLTASKKYAAAQTSLESNPGHSSHSSRTELLQGIRQKIEAHYRTPLNDGIANKDGNGVKVLLSAYRILGTTSKPIAQYAKHTMRTLATKPITDMNDVGLLCTELCTYLHSELDWILDVFKELAPNVICTTVTVVIGAAKPNIAKYLELHAQSQYSDIVACHHFIDQLLQFCEGVIFSSFSEMVEDEEEAFLTEAELKSSHFDRVQRPALVKATMQLREAIDWLLPYQLNFSSFEEALIKSGSRDALGTMVRCLNFTLGLGVHSLPSLMVVLFEKSFGEMEDSLSRVRADYILAHLKPSSDINWELFNVAIKLFNRSVAVGLQLKKLIQHFSFLFLSLKTPFSLAHSPAFEIQQSLERVPVELEGFDGKINLGSLTSWTFLSESSLNNEQFRQFLNRFTPASPVCFEKVLDQLAELQTSLLKVQFDILFQPLEAHLKAYSPKSNPNIVSKIEIPKFSLVPTAAISSLGERLLTLTQRLEPYTSEPSLYKYMHKINAQLESCDVLEVVAPPIKSDVLQTWISSLAHRAMAHFVLKIKDSFVKASSLFTLTQVHTDASYLINVVTALGVSPSPDLAFLGTLSGMDSKRFLALTLLQSSADEAKWIEILTSYPEFDDSQDLCHHLLSSDQTLDGSTPGQFVRTILTSSELLDSLKSTCKLVSSFSK